MYIAVINIPVELVGVSVLVEPLLCVCVCVCLFVYLKRKYGYFFTQLRSLTTCKYIFKIWNIF